MKKTTFLTDLNMAMTVASHTKTFGALVITRVVARYSTAIRNHL